MSGSFPGMIQELCDRGQRELIEMRYLQAERTLAQAEKLAMETRDWDALSRLYLPLQETRRQRRQRCGEGTIRLDLIARGPTDLPGVDELALRYAQGQLLVAGWGTLAPAIALRERWAQLECYAETFLAASYPIGGGIAVVIAPLADVAMPAPDHRDTIDQLLPLLPAQCIVLKAEELPPGECAGTSETYAQTMLLWERLHAPFLAAAFMQRDAQQQIKACQTTLRVDYACELAHQKLAEVARELDRNVKTSLSNAARPV